MKWLKQLFCLHIWHEIDAFHKDYPTFLHHLPWHNFRVWKCNCEKVVVRDHNTVMQTEYTTNPPTP